MRFQEDVDGLPFIHDPVHNVSIVQQSVFWILSSVEISYGKVTKKTLIPLDQTLEEKLLPTQLVPVKKTVW